MLRTLLVFLDCVLQVRALFRSVEDERSGSGRLQVVAVRRKVTPSLSPEALAALDDDQATDEREPPAKRPLSEAIKQIGHTSALSLSLFPTFQLNVGIPLHHQSRQDT